MPKQIVVIEVDYFDETGVLDPAEWNWTEMVGDDCTVIAAGPVTDKDDPPACMCGFRPHNDGDAEIHQNENHCGEA